MWGEIKEDANRVKNREEIKKEKRKEGKKNTNGREMRRKHK